MQNVLIAGGSGLLGRSLTKILQQHGYSVAWLSRRGGMEHGVRKFSWDLQQMRIDKDAIPWADVLIHLAGEGIAEKRWTSARKKQIINSRVQSTALLLQAMQQYPGKVKTIISASAIGYYGGTPGLLHEDMPAGSGFLADSVSVWEQATAQFASTGARCVTFRIGIVLTREGGAYAELTKTAALRILPVVGSGKQVYSWITAADLMRLMLFAIETPLSGTFNAVAPHPVRIHDLMHTVARVKKGFYILPPVPAWAIRLVFGEMADVVLVDQWVSSEKILKAGFLFQHTDISTAIEAIENGG